MKRRDVLAWISRGLAAATAATVGVPGVQYVLGTLKPSPSESATFRRVARLADLPAARPLLVPVLGQKQDAWIRHADEVLGRVWLVRREAPQTGVAASTADAGPSCEVQAFTSLCPHMGCQIQLRGPGASFVCPCHKATFGLDGARLSPQETGERNHAPRGMDRLESRVVRDEATGEWWVEVQYEKFVPGLTRQVASA